MRLLSGSLFVLWLASSHSFALTTPSLRRPLTLTRTASSLGNKLEQFDPSAIRCPFFRRRASDLLEAAVLCGRWLASRHKSIDLTFGLFPLTTLARPSEVKLIAANARKLRDLPLTSLAALLSDDFALRQCQVTGRLSREIFDESCIFDGPDPDMPVTGVGKYLSASRNLFNHAQSRCDLLGVGLVPAPPKYLGDGHDRKEPTGTWAGHKGEGVLVLWRIEGTINLPWHPSIKPYLGATLFQRQCVSSEENGHGLITQATEWWSTSAADAFLSTVPAWRESGFASPAARPAATLRERLQPIELLASFRGVPRELLERTIFVEDGGICNDRRVEV
mmetsp:Transcript_35645/g.72650  ORF Transcript_35645/g.72650 Transcript_35645/m.72650 type:complete len:334 (+) Transcript_35645:91-1092(+)|eukprot:CAMPEP_0171593782 /NCGR_PEP_ID=MMETSP0990-20121206/317_1 /TAXON_ID=483369 /ORGANISM="non described non described, Strain CCMP2098" /LENGTH=333 /DNA_ID=CAMNT_0012154383 /DNA_START=85 /DNA_END=1086 /DNA_ORIENTATION=-